MNTPPPVDALGHRPIEPQLTYTETESPLMQWWHHSRSAIDAACHDASATPEQADGLRTLLDRAARGDLPVDDFRLRLVLGYLGLACNTLSGVLEEHRQWEASR